MEKITFEEFRQMVAEELDVDAALVVAEARFVEDLMADSIRLVEMMLQLEERGVTIPLEEAWQVQTVGEAYRLYAERLDAGPGAERERRPYAPAH